MSEEIELRSEGGAGDSGADSAPDRPLGHHGDLSDTDADPGRELVVSVS